MKKHFSTSSWISTQRSLLFKILFCFIVTCFLLATSFAYHNKVASFHFVDEEDNFVLGKYLLEGKKVYGNLFSHHQPLAYVFSAGIQKATHPNSIYLLLKWHRDIMILLTIAGSLLLTWRFGLRMLFFIFIFELTKIYLLGNIFLSESLVIYPLVYVVALLLSHQKSLRRAEHLLFGVCLSLIILLLAPLWPLCILLSLLYVQKFHFKHLPLVLLGGLPPLLVSLFFISLPQYFYNVFYINFFYYIPLDSHHSTLVNVLLAFLSPLISFIFFDHRTSTLSIAQTCSLVLVVASGFLIKKKRMYLPMTAFLALGFSNIRYVPIGQEFYNGFHLLPWYALIIMFTGYALVEVFTLAKSRNVKIVVLMMVFVLFGLAVKESLPTLWRKADTQHDLYVNYSTQFTMGEAVSIMKTKGDTLFVAPDEWLVYWQANIQPASTMINYYPWMTKVPHLRAEVESTFQNRPPTFFYLHGSSLDLEKYLAEYNVLSKDGQRTSLFVRKKKLSSLTPAQKEALSFHHFEVQK